ncbi:hypothetical protein NQ317_002437 [Molorchus minor]|uniref:Uncharacterized protein n=1 Tax=Molorchus minor TaxID=1323400 RepID=A0ABQ9IXU8_9CUCU|nr:hypothetical protein NQ317_002437 [Molorchus minor]
MPTKCLIGYGAPVRARLPFQTRSTTRSVMWLPTCQCGWFEWFVTICIGTEYGILRKINTTDLGTYAYPRIYYAYFSQNERFVCIAFGRYELEEMLK